RAPTTRPRRHWPPPGAARQRVRRERPVSPGPIPRSQEGWYDRLAKGILTAKRTTAGLFAQFVPGSRGVVCLRCDAEVQRPLVHARGRAATDRCRRSDRDRKRWAAAAVE